MNDNDGDKVTNNINALLQLVGDKISLKVPPSRDTSTNILLVTSKEKLVLWCPFHHAYDLSITWT